MKEGQQVVCIRRIPWEWEDSDEIIPGPAYGEIVTIKSLFEDCITLHEYRRVGEYEPAYKKYNFAPLMDISELVEILQTEPQPL